MDADLRLANLQGAVGVVLELQGVAGVVLELRLAVAHGHSRLPLDHCFPHPLVAAVVVYFAYLRDLSSPACWMEVVDLAVPTVVAGGISQEMM